MITSLTISNYKSFHPTTSVEIRFNTQQKPVLIYGLNGAGKSAIGEVIHRWDQKDPAVSHCPVAVSGQGPFRALVYNHEFVERVVGGVAGMPGIFTLGELDTEAQKEIDAHVAESQTLEGKREELTGLIATTSDAVAGLREAALAQVWKAHTAHIRGPLGHLIPGYGNSRQKFFDDLRAVQVTDDEVLDSEDQLKQRWDDAASNEPKKSALTLDTAGLATVESDPVWAESIQVSGESRLSELIARWGNSDWVNQGRAYSHDAECPFCQQSLPGDFHAELAKLLDGDRQTKIDDLTDKVATYARRVREIEAAVKLILEEPLAQQDDPLNTAWKAFQAVLSANQVSMRTKLDRPAESISLVRTDPKVLTDALASINLRITAFNQRIADRDLEKKRIRAEFMRHLRRDRASAYEALDAALVPLSAQLATQREQDQQAQTRLQFLSNRLAELRRQQTGVDAAVVAINQRLSNMGIASFSIKRKPGQGSLYGLNRPGQPDGQMNSLSEGEKTLISFLYFMELLKGAHKESEVIPLDKTMVIIDDPISSLSVNYVFDVASVIYWELIEPANGPKARQVIVLTHNLFFLHEMLRQLRVMQLDKAENKCQLLRVVKGEHTQVVEMRATDLMNDYDALWWVLREAVERQMPAHMVPNTMRCILEHFFSFNNRQEWKAGLIELEQDDHRFRALARFLDRGSHKDGINFSVMDYGEHDIAYYLEKFRAVFDKAGFIDHYNARMGLAAVAPPEANA